MQKMLIIEDLSALGQISMVSAISVATIMNVKPALLPTIILSTQSEGFGDPVSLTLEQWQNKAIKHWNNLEQEFDTMMIGYIGCISGVQNILSFLPLIRKKKLVVDPAMADQGSLYPNLPLTYPSMISTLCQYADVIVPNLTEACLLAKVDYANDSINQSKLNQLVDKLVQRFPSTEIIITGVPLANKLVVVYVNKKNIASPMIWSVESIARHFYGTGDIFTAIVSACLAKKMSTEKAVKIAINALELAVKDSAQLTDHELLYGLKMTRLQEYLLDIEGNEIDEK